MDTFRPLGAGVYEIVVELRYHEILEEENSCDYCGSRYDAACG